MKYESKEALYNFVMLTMLKTNKDNCLSILNNLRKTDISFMLTLIENNVEALIYGNILTRKMVDNIHNIYYYLLDNDKENRIEIVNSYNALKTKLNSACYDENERMIFEDIRIKEFGVINLIGFLTSLTKSKEFYNTNYKQLMDNIAFDYEVIAYLINKDIEEDDAIIYDPRVSKCIRYICVVYPDFLEDLEFREKIDTILKIGKRNKAIKKDCQKTLKIIKKIQN